jgi:hypothetical protein
MHLMTSQPKQPGKTLREVTMVVHKQDAHGAKGSTRL